MPTSRRKKSSSQVTSRSLSYGRPPSLPKPRSILSSRASRRVIRLHHNLRKAHAQALASNDHERASQIQRRIDASGGLPTYQTASIAGQSSSRGGDSSKILVEWLGNARRHALRSPVASQWNDCRLRMLEVGALSTTNACSRSKLFHVTRIDLHAQGSGILQQDFMERPFPQSEQEKFDVISLSLVLNYVPDPKGRGDMLRKTRSFLRLNVGDELENVQAEDNDDEKLFPCLFLVLPVSCMTNSRYLLMDRLIMMMESLGYKLAEQKLSARLAYSLWRWRGCEEHRAFSKTEINPGKTRNNFAIVLD